MRGGDCLRHPHRLPSYTIVQSLRYFPSPEQDTTPRPPRPLYSWPLALLRHMSEDLHSIGTSSCYAGVHMQPRSTSTLHCMQPGSTSTLHSMQPGYTSTLQSRVFKYIKWLVYDMASTLRGWYITWLLHSSFVCSRPLTPSQ